MIKNLLCVLIPHYNAFADLKASLASISPNENIDVLIVDDGSQVSPKLEEIKPFFAGKGTIHLLVLDKNGGIENALNKGLEYIIKSQYEFVARLDAGDICAPDRFAKQQEFLVKNKDILLVGSWVTYVSADKSLIFQRKFPTNYKEIRKVMYYENVLIHPAVAFRTSVVSKVGFYPTNFPACEDYAWFMSICENGKVANIPEFLLEYVLSPGSISHRKRTAQTISKFRIVCKHFRFRTYCIYGLFKFGLLIILPYSLVKKIKAILYK